MEGKREKSDQNQRDLEFGEKADVRVGESDGIDDL